MVLVYVPEPIQPAKYKSLVARCCCLPQQLREPSRGGDNAALGRVSGRRASAQIRRHGGLAPHQRGYANGNRSQHDNQPQHQHQGDAAPISRHHRELPSGNATRSGGSIGPESFQNLSSIAAGTNEGNRHA